MVSFCWILHQKYNYATSRLYYNKGSAMILNHVDGSKNQSRITRKINVILASGIKVSLFSCTVNVSACL